MNSATTFTNLFFKNVFHKAIITVASFAYLLIVSGDAFAATQTYVSNGVFTVPVGVNQLTVSMSGAGGGGGALSNSGAGQDGGATSLGAILTAAGGRGGRNGSADIGGGAGGLAGGIGGNNGLNGTNIGFGGNGGSSLFGVGGTGNANMFYAASNGTGYGAGGGGGFDGGGAGGAQAFSSTTVSVAPGQIIPITIGAGGAGSLGDNVMAAGGRGAPGFIQITYTLDTVAPVITLIGTTPVTVNIGTPYIDAGATAFDNIDGDITSSIITVNSVNTNAVGIYTVSYTVSDSSGNAAVQVTRTVNVVDISAPIITILGNNPETVVQGAVYVDAGATAFDATDGDVTASIVAVNTVDSFTVGSYTVIYTASDLSGNTASSTRIIDVVAPIPLSSVTITNSTIDGIFYASYTPTVASSTALGITGTSSIANSTITAPFNLTDVTFNNVTLTNATLAQTNAASSTFINAFLTGCTVTNSFVKNYFAIGCTIADSIVDPVNGLNDLTGTNVSGGSSIYFSDVTYSTIVSSYIATSTITASFLTNATSTNSTIATSTITNSVLDLSTVTLTTLDGSILSNTNIASSNVATSTINGGSITDSNVVNSTLSNAIVASSTLSNTTILGAGSTITNSTLVGVTITDAVIVNDIMSSGTILLPDGTPLVITSPTPLSNLVNYAPLASFTATSTTLLQATFTDFSSDVNTGTIFPDSWTYSWDFGDGSTTTVATSTLGNNQNHTYAAGGTYLTTLTLLDQYGLSSTATSTVILAGPAAPDTTAPVISISGSNPTSLVVGSLYADLGATALDNIDGDVTSNIVATSTVDTTLVGIYSVVYTVSDIAGNTSTSTRTVNILATADITAPIITLIGASSTSVTINTVYTDLGATSIDNVDGDITAAIVTTGIVDTTTLGSYTLLYSSTDSSLNTATTTRVVDVVALPVVDIISPSAPIITGVNTLATTTLSSTLIADWNDSIDDSGSLAGYSFVWDTLPGTNPDTIVEGQATTTTATLPNGTWYFHVVAMDPSLNISTPTTTFGPIVVNNAPAGDTTAPTGPIIITSSTHVVSVDSASTTVSLDWDAATDNIGLAGYSYIWDTNATGTPDNVADTALLSLTTNLTNGSWHFHILSVDTSGNVSSPVIDFGPIVIATTTVDTTTPVGPTAVTSATHTVSLSSVNQSVDVSWDTATDETVLAGYSYIWDTATSTVPDAIPDTAATTSTTILANGTWYFHVQSVDTAGNVSAPAVHFGPIIISTVVPLDTIAPSAPVALVTISSTSTMSVSWSDATDNSGSIAGYSFVWDTNPLTIPDSITETQGTSTITIVADGLWYFHIVAVDPSLNVSTPVTHVGPIKIDTTAPVLTLVGASIVPIVVGDIYTDLGATALDTIDGNITASVVASSTVDTAVVGTYTVTYSVSDASGNTAPQIIRTVHVLAILDIIPPVITLVGPSPVTVVVGNSYTDAGVFATDNIDGNITASIVTLNLVNTGAVGAYSVDYTVSDSSGNTATSSRTVNVIVPAIFSIDASVVGNGSITPNATTTVTQGSNQAFTITPNFGHEIIALIIDGTSIATSTVHTFTNVQASHTISVVFAQIATAPSFTLFASVNTNGTISPIATTTIQQGNNQTYAMTPTLGYSMTSLLIDGVATTTNPTFSFLNVNGNHTIDVTFADITTPSGPTVATSSSHTTSIISANQIADMAWGVATDNIALAGYSYAWDTNAIAIPDANPDTITTNSSTLLPYGTWYFHVVSVDTAGNISTPAVHFGPIVISDSQVLITNTTLNGVPYALFSPTVASSTAWGITGTSTITNSTIVAPSTLANVLVATSTLTQTNASDSTITNSTLTNATTTNSTIDGSTVINAVVASSTLSNVQITGTSSVITNSTLLNTSVVDAVITDGIMTSGTIILPNGTPFTVSTSTPLTNLINYAPVAAFATSVSNLIISVTDVSTDPNNGSAIDSWVYNWDFGDSVVFAPISTATLGNNKSHTYANAGTYLITLTITDQNGLGLSSTATSSVTVSAFVPTPSSGGGGSGGGGSSWGGTIIGSTQATTTTSVSTSTAPQTATTTVATPIAVITPVVAKTTAAPVSVTPTNTISSTPSPAETEVVATETATRETTASGTTTTTPSGKTQLASIIEAASSNAIILWVLAFFAGALALIYSTKKKFFSLILNKLILFINAK